MLRHEKIRDQLRRSWEGERVAELCIRLLDYVVKSPTQLANYLTYRKIGEILSVTPEDGDLNAAIALLSQRYHVLELHMRLFDNAGEEYDLTRDELSGYFETGLLAHPHTGILLDDPEALLIPYFRGAKDDLLSEVSDER